MAELTVQTVTRLGVTMSAQNITGTSGTPDTFSNNGQTVLFLYNAAVTDTTVSAKFDYTVDGKAPADKAVTVPASTTANPVAFGPFPTNLYGNTVSIYTSDTSNTTGYVVSL